MGSQSKDHKSPTPECRAEAVRDLARGCTVRALIVGVLGALCIAFGSPYNDMIVKGTPLARWSSTPAAIFLFFVLVALINTFLGLVHRRLALQRGELAVSYFLMVLTNTMAGGFAGYVLPVNAGAYYYATVENDWRGIVHPYLPDWITPRNSEVIWRFFEGHPSGVPWSAWIIPLLSWLTFGLALFLTMFCLMVIMRRQWVEYERLPYPMAQLPLAMIAGDERGRALQPLFRSPFMWAGFAIPFVLASLTALHSYSVAFPKIQLILPSIPIVQDMAHLSLRIYPSLVGFSYFIPQNVALGLWFFHILNQVQRGIFGALGIYSREESLGPYAGYTDPIIMHQAMGGMRSSSLSGSARIFEDRSFFPQSPPKTGQSWLTVADTVNQDTATDEPRKMLDAVFFRKNSIRNLYYHEEFRVIVRRQASFRAEKRLDAGQRRRGHELRTILAVHVDADCFAVAEPVRVPADTLLSQLV